MSAHIQVICRHQQKQSLDLAFLSAAEQGRMQKMSPPRGRIFAQGRSLLRQELSVLLGVAPADVPLTQTDQGPMLQFGRSNKGHILPSFSVSHSGDYIAVAIAADGIEVGLDIEDISALKPVGSCSKAFEGRHDYRKIMTRYFRTSEQQWIAAQPWPERAFYKLWTLKEAITKMERGAIAHYLKGAEIDAGEDPISLIGSTPTGRETCHLNSYDYPHVMLSVASAQACDIDVQMVI